MSSDAWERPVTQPASYPGALDIYGHLSYQPWLSLAEHIDQFIRSRFGSFNRAKEQQDG